MRTVITRCALIILSALSAMLPGIALADTVLVTGANSGIGLEFAKQYAAKGWTVIATHRRAQIPGSLQELSAKFKNVRVESLDVTNLAQVKELATRLANVPIDVLINNAAVYIDRSGCAAGDEACPGDWSSQTFGRLSYPLLDNIMAVNIKGPLAVSEAFFRHVKASHQKKIIQISTALGTLTGEGAGWPGALFYRSSKAALNKTVQIVATTVKSQGVIVLALDPGPVITEHNSQQRGTAGWLETPVTVDHMVKTIDKSTIADTGHFLRYDGAVEPW